MKIKQTLENTWEIKANKISNKYAIKKHSLT